ncbi:hypothetical protein CcaverHIS002_0106470 [Cutaneotrichosporon cavernicola]|uniref:MARVEL domain-containing protein n=1 Tax=Cutaneotrichosporon cavernicola TaxID=279322 RepID=A0AA48L227_9TREE|nr:uncharacterized protein CcaverHIS019_0106410 [Cutaneotrichosporon cavernicola]BEI80118.1 hypothetical protein CcaverHIS002_0106470 [Cutaneotrichosporon cavernicola]BEI87923.1 hypothetical protein CcaverHIS019_0106410 [Cutaneotrichosporon cavernicola]BEI95697.1 hypothetical protein CcaverHIS631_0106460 [Cutaneotrichosporon cavernicola]
MKPATAVRSALLLSLAAAAASVGCMTTYVSRARFNAIASDRDDITYAQDARIGVYVSLGSSAAVVVYVLLFFYLTALYPLSRLIYVWVDVMAISLLLWASAATGGILSPLLPSLWKCHTPLCKIALAGSILKWSEVVMVRPPLISLTQLATSLAIIIVSQLRHPGSWSTSLDHLHLPKSEEVDNHALTMRALYESQLLRSVSLASTAPSPRGYTLYAVASPNSIALPLPAHSRQTKRVSRLSSRLSQPITYFNSWAEGKVPSPSPLSQARPRHVPDSRLYARI